MSEYRNQLRQALTKPLGSHLNEAVLAEIATAEVAGEDVETLFANELAHLEMCVHCAEGYAALVALMETAVSEMTLRAEEISEINKANTLWQRANTVILQAQTTLENGLATFWQTLQFGLEPQFVPLQKDIPSTDSQSRSLFSGEVGELIPLVVQIEAQRYTPVSCELLIYVDRLMMTGGAGLQVMMRYAEVEKTAVTDSKGMVVFNDIPIAALENLTISIEDNS